MINQFRKRLIAMTTGLVAIILIAAFTAIFVTTYLNQKSDNYEKLNQAEQLRITGGKVTFDEKSEDAMEINRIVTGAGVYFNMLVNKSGKPIMIDSALKLTKDQYNKAAKYAWKNQDGGVIKMNGREWQYVVAPAIANFDYGSSDQTNGENDETYLMRFLDITDSKKNLSSLAMTLIIVGIGLLLFFFLVIIFFTNRALHPVEEAWKKQKQFITDASHELKTPLSIISTNVDVLYSSQEETISEQIKWLNNISSGTKRMNGLVNKLLTVAKADNSFDQLTITNVQIDQLLTNALSNYETKFAEKKILINKNMAKVIVKTDEVLLQQLFDIFIDNASKYTNENGAFDVSVEAKGREGIITFRNTGDGITDEDLPKIFDRFYRTNEVRQKYEGSYGLGLSIAQGIADQLGGKIDVESTVNETTVFTIRLPLKKQFSKK
ncbi:sensor histidine kinase [Enterococcus malodoratus]|uniref:sensor histidine kinase n=1 Tax=Enterococcus malodoratus TaxID=71451 RepID=UPI00039D0C08|nr:HAMP domain-containing sensor histidine kinase [Enterococcus malodoratus]